MKKCVPILMIVVCFALGLHWSLLQGVAWIGMLIDHSQDRPIAQALEDTFDGEHPCCLCKLVDEGRSSDEGTRHEMIQVLKDLKLLPPTTEDLAVQRINVPPTHYSLERLLDCKLPGFASKIDRPPSAVGAA